jgi:hypothetical protein
VEGMNLQFISSVIEFCKTHFEIIKWAGGLFSVPLGGIIWLWWDLIKASHEIKRTARTTIDRTAMLPNQADRKPECEKFRVALDKLSRPHPRIANLVGIDVLRIEEAKTIISTWILPLEQVGPYSIINLQDSLTVEDKINDEVSHRLKLATTFKWPWKKSEPKLIRHYVTSTTLPTKKELTIDGWKDIK